MRLLRAICAQLTPFPEDFKSVGADQPGLKLQTLLTSKSQEEGLVVLVAEIALEYQPKRTGSGDIVVPDRDRRRAQAALESLANVLAVSHNARRQLTSPMPYVGFGADSDDDVRLLEESKGIHGHVGRSRPFFPIRLGTSDRLIEALADRMDGLALLTEAKSTGHATGRFHEFIRLFERAFRHPADKQLVPQLTQVTTPYFEYSEAEVGEWMELRGPATHADERNEFLLEGDVRHVMGRMEQAAYDVLLNKANWRRNDADRRELWFPPAGTIGADEQAYIVVNDTTPQLGALSDQWGDYLLNFQRWEGLDDWWPKTAHKYEASAGTLHVVHPPPGTVVWGTEPTK